MLTACAAAGFAAQAQPLKITGKAGYLSEWELNADVQASGRVYAGPMTLKHIGLCSTNGPEHKSGEIRLELSRLSSAVTATLSFDGNTCTYRGKLVEDYTGIMDCPGTRGVPLTLRMR